MIRSKKVGSIKYLNIEDIRISIRKKGKIDSFNSFIKIRPGIIEGNNFFILESDYNKWKLQD